MGNGSIFFKVRISQNLPACWRAVPTTPNASYTEGRAAAVAARLRIGATPREITAAGTAAATARRAGIKRAGPRRAAHRVGCGVDVDAVAVEDAARVGDGQVRRAHLAARIRILITGGRPPHASPAARSLVVRTQSGRAPEGPRVVGRGHASLSTNSRHLALHTVSGTSGSY
jgi:hypothetical protein